VHERRIFGVIGAAAAVVVGLISVFDLEDVRVVDVLVITVAAGSYLLYGAWPRCPPWVPFAVACLTVLVLNLPDMRAEGAMFFIVLGLAHVALNESRRLVVLACGFGAAASIGILVASDSTDWSWQYWVIGFGVGAGTGELAHRFRLARDELVRTRALVADQAALEERQRIARDVHDVVGHSLTIVMLQLTAARHLLRRDPDEADAALADAERVGRDSLNQVRRTVGMLRTDEGASGRDHDAPPTLEDLEQLLADYRSAGISVRADVDGPLVALDAARSVAGYRIVQEALTNVSKHSPTAETRVTVAVDGAGGVCRIVVASRGRSDDSGSPTSKLGLVGMRERARSVGGIVTAGPDEDGWTVSAELPPLGGNEDTGV
jgi:signal transduction histidine kinase